MEVFPESLVAEDIDRRIPFQLLIHHWVVTGYKQVELAGRDSLLYLAGIQSRVGSFVKATETRKVLMKNIGKVFGSVSAKGDQGVLDVKSKVDLRSALDLHASLATSDEPFHQFTPVVLTASAAWAFDLLSVGFQLLGSSGSRTMGYSRQRLARSKLATHVASIPVLVKTIFLIEDDEARSGLLEQPVIRCALLTEESVGLWMVEMLQSKGLAAQRAVDYFVVVSSVGLADFVGTFRTPLQDDIDAYTQTRSEMLTAFNKFTGKMVPILYGIPEKEIERAASTAIIWDMMDRGLARPFVVGMALVDCVLHLTLLLSFRNSVIEPVVGLASQAPAHVVNMILAFFLIRKISEAMALFVVSTTVLRSYLTDLWNAFDILAIALTIAASGWGTKQGYDQIEYKSGLNAFVVALLWFKVLAFLKAINMQMSIFILSAVNIISDVRFFSAVLIVVIMMFGDMMHIIFTTSNGLLCENPENPVVSDFCNPQIAQSYLRMYGVLIGDFSLEEYQDSPTVTFLFFTFTVLGVIVLLNVLIAVVSGSYERSTGQARSLFGRARVGFLTQNLALEVFLQPGSNPIAGFSLLISRRRVLACVFVIFRWAVLLMLAGTAFVAELYLYAQAIESIDGTSLDNSQSFVGAIFNVVMALMISGGLFVLFEFIFSGFYANVPRNSGLGLLVGCLECSQHAVIRFVQVRLFGVVDQTEETTRDLVDRLDIVEKTITTLIQSSEHKVLLTVQASEQSLRENGKNLAEDIKGQINIFRT